jgi:hypothetical protein
MTLTARQSRIEYGGIYFFRTADDILYGELWGKVGIVDGGDIVGEIRRSPQDDNEWRFFPDSGFDFSAKELSEVITFLKALDKEISNSKIW